MISNTRQSTPFPEDSYKLLKNSSTLSFRGPAGGPEPAREGSRLSFVYRARFLDPLGMTMVRTTSQRCRSWQFVRAHLALLAAVFVAWGAFAQDSGPARDTWQHPEEVMDAIEVHAGSVVADVGCGAGYFTFHLADRVGPSGHVYAVDILQSRLDEIDREIRKEGLKQITTILGSPDDPHLQPDSLDAVLAMNTFHEWRQYDSMLTHLYQALKPGGLFGLIDGVASPGHPRSYYYERHRMPEEMERADLLRAGFHFVRQEPGFTNPEEGKKFYFLIFEKPR